MIVNFSGPRSFILIQDPEIVQDIYVKYNKFYNKSGRIKDQFYDLAGESIFMIESNEVWSQKRKHLTAAFYKDKMINMLETIIDLSYDQIQQWKKEYAG